MGVQTRNTALRKMRVLILLSVLSLLLGVSFGSVGQNDEPNEAARRQSDASRRQSFNQRPPPFFGNWPSRRQSDNPPPPFVGSWSRRQSDASRRQFNNPPPPFVGSCEQSPDMPDSELLHTPCN